MQSLRKAEQRRRRNILLIFAVAFVGMLVSKGLALVPGYAFDDYSVVNAPRALDFTISQGRFTQSLLQLGVTTAGVSATHAAWTFSLLFFVAAAAAVALGLDYVTRGQCRLSVIAGIAALITTYPYLTEYFTFRESLVPQSIAFCLVALILWRAGKEGSGPSRSLLSPLSLALLVLLAGCQQTAYIVVVFFLFGRFVFDIDRGVANAWSLNATVLWSLVVSFALYVALAVSVREIAARGLHVDARGMLIDVTQIPLRLHQVADLTVSVLFRSEPVVAQGLKFGLISCLILGIGVEFLRRPQFALVLTTAWALMFSLSLLLVSVSSVWWPVPRALYASVFASGVALALMYRDSGRLLTTAVAVVLVVCSALGALKSNQMLVDQQRLNRWDLWTASAIYDRAVQQGFSDQQTLRLVGAGWRHPGRLDTIQGDLNASALIKTWAVAGVFREATGRELRVASVPQDPALCSGKAVWPARGSVFEVELGFVVCMQ